MVFTKTGAKDLSDVALGIFDFLLNLSILSVLIRKMVDVFEVFGSLSEPVGYFAKILSAKFLLCAVHSPESRWVFKGFS